MVLMAPSVPGLYDATYFLESGDTLIARATFEVTEATVALSVPGKVRAGTPFAVTWSDAINTADYISILPSGAERHSEKYYRVKDAVEMTLTAPGTVGLYDVAYFLESGDRLLARATFEVLDADAPLDDGAGLSVPGAAGIGEVIMVTWTGGGTGGDERIALARKDQPDFSWIVAVEAGEEKTVSITLPDEPGLYEVRFLDIAAPAVLGRSVVEVK